MCEDIGGLTFGGPGHLSTHHHQGSYVIPSTHKLAGARLPRLAGIALDLTGEACGMNVVAELVWQSVS